MKRLDITKKLSLISFCLSGACILIQACVPAFEKIVAHYNFFEQTMPVVIATIISALKMLPFAAVCFWNWQQNTMTQMKAMVTVILAPVLYVLGGLLTTVIAVIISHMFGADELGAYSVFSNVQNVFSLLLLAGLVLICCACAIDLYALKHHPISQNE